MSSVFEILNKINIKGSLSLSENMKAHTTFKCGGVAEFFFIPDSIEDLLKVISASKKYNFPFFILGGGANLLVSDKGIPGVTVSMANLNSASISQNTLITEAGLSVTKLGEFALENSLSGLEFIHGMPGSVGGAVFMNARCYGKEISDIFLWADYITTDGEVKRIEKNDFEWQYKISPFQKESNVILRAAFELETGEHSKIKSIMDKNFRDRRDKGHFKFPCAGSIFKNNRAFGAPSGQIIEEVGLKGLRRGDAQISDFHANIIVNLGNATASDINFLIEKTITVVKDKKGISLEPEVLKVGNWES